MTGIPIPIEALAIASVIASLACLFVAGIHGIRAERHNQDRKQP